MPDRMEPVSLLAGGLAHDLNNMLAGMLGSMEMMRRRLGKDAPDGVLRYMDAAEESARRAANLTQRLLAFAGRQPLHPVQVHLPQFLVVIKDDLHKQLGEGVVLHLPDAEAVEHIVLHCDPVHLHGAFMGMAANARDAMPSGGEFRIHVHAPSIGEDGRIYVLVDVEDTGMGMAPDVMLRAFDPFFTTKPIGAGTGLGLSMLHGFVKQSGGRVTLRSEVSLGTTVSMFMPVHEVLPALPLPLQTVAKRLQGQPVARTVLVVEDDELVRELVVEAVRDMGYLVMEAKDGSEGLMYSACLVPGDMLLTDVGLPGLNGRQLADAARIAHPWLPVLFMTGYAHSEVEGNLSLGEGMGLLSKPFTLSVLCARVQDFMGDAQTALDTDSNPAHAQEVVMAPLI